MYAQFVTVFNIITGEKIGELKSDQFPSIMGKISVKGDELAIPGWYDGVLHLFMLHYT